MGYAYGLMCLLSFSVATGFVLVGWWQVLIFTVLEMTAVAAAFLYYARHARDYERIRLVQGQLLVERASAGNIKRCQLELYHLRLEVPQRPGDLIYLKARDVEVAIGHHTPLGQRRALARELRHELGLF
jgi:uncharacterized membrane protein